MDKNAARTPQRFVPSKSTRYRLRKQAKLLLSSSPNNTAISNLSSKNYDTNIDPVSNIEQNNSLHQNICENNLILDNLSESSKSLCSTLFSSEIDEVSEPDCEELFDLNLIIATWAIKHQIPHIVLNDLLKNLRKSSQFSNLPKDARTLLKTPTTTTVKNIDGGVYHHFSIKEEVKLLMKYCDLPPKLNLIVGIDGLPITKNPPSSLWPILGHFSNLDILKPNVFIIGAFYGKSKPTDANEYLSDFVFELKDILSNGIIIDDKHFSLDVHAILCDAPAKSFILKVQGHTGKHSCVRCTTVGIRDEGRICFPDLDAPIRCHESYLDCNDNQFHLGKSILSEIPKLNLVTSIPYDYMHLVCIGVTKKLITFWINSKHKHALPKSRVNELDKIMNSLKYFIPQEFQRRPSESSRLHPFHDINRWKATELRQCLLYTGFVIFLGHVKEEIYNNFVILSVAIRIILTEHVTLEYYDYAKSLLRHFVESFQSIYGKAYISHNIHALIHIADDAKKYGSLNNFSCFPFESFMQPIKKQIRSGMKPLQQLVHRYAEEKSIQISNFNKNSTFSTHNGPLKYHSTNQHRPLISGVQNPQFTGWRLSNMILKLNSADNCVQLIKGSIVAIENIAMSSVNNDIMIVGREYENVGSFFNFPCNSSILNIYKADNLGPLRCWKLTDISKKMVRLPIKQSDDDKSMLILPFVHLQ